MPTPQPDAVHSLAFHAARPELCLDFANTRCWRGTEAPEESLRLPADLLGWAEKSGGVSGSLTAHLAGISPAAQACLLDEAIALREAIYRAFSAVATEGTPAHADLESLNAALALAPGRTALVRDHGHFAWSSDVGQLPGRMAPIVLAPVLWSAADLLVQGEAHRIRRCANEKCLWLFVDRSKAGTRRWCDMGACGNRAKSQRHYARVKAG